MEFYNKRTRVGYREFLKGKRVVLVGPSPSIIGSGQGGNIDKYDVVVRLNKALPVPTHLVGDIGSRCDVLYNCMNPTFECGGKISLDVLESAGVKFLVGAFPPLDHMDGTPLRLKSDLERFYKTHSAELDTLSFCYFDFHDYFKKLWEELKLPNTGIMAILDLLKHDIKSLYITGITFFKGGYYKDYRPYNEKEVLKKMSRVDLHQPELQLNYMATRLLQSSRCSFDKALEDILHEAVGGKDVIKKKVRSRVDGKVGGDVGGIGKVGGDGVEEGGVSSVEKPKYSPSDLEQMSKCFVVIWKKEANPTESSSLIPVM